MPLGRRKMPSIGRPSEADMNVCRNRPLIYACAATYEIHHLLSTVGQNSRKLMSIMESPASDRYDQGTLLNSTMTCGSELGTCGDPTWRKMLGWQVLSIVSERTRRSDAICIAASKVTLERPRGFSRGSEETQMESRKREREKGVVRRYGDSIFLSARVDSRHTRPQVG